MLNFQSLIIHGLIFTLLAHLGIAFILKVNPRYEMKSYPKEILACVPPQTKEEKLGFVKLAIPMMFILIGYLAWSLITTYKGTGIGYWVLWLHVFGMFSLWNLIDLLVMDWLIFCNIQPRFMALPGTYGHPGYKNYMYHFRGFLIGCIFSIIGTSIFTGITIILL